MKQFLIISETSSSTWSYHLRLIASGGEKYSGGAGKALCGKELGWDVKMPLESYGKSPSHIPMKFCSKCLEEARLQKLPGIEDIK